MPSFALADLKDRASKAKDSGVTRFNNTRDKYTSASSKNMNWDPNHKAPPPPPSSANARPARPTPSFLPPPSRTSSYPSSSNASGNTPSPPPPVEAHPGPPPMIPRATRPDYNAPPTYGQAVPAPPPPPRRTTTTSTTTTTTTTRTSSSMSMSKFQTNDPEDIDWTNLTEEDKLVFFSWLDEFFAKYLGVPVSTLTKTTTMAGTGVGRRGGGGAAVVSPMAKPPLPVWSRPT